MRAQPTASYVELGALMWFFNALQSGQLIKGERGHVLKSLKKLRALLVQHEFPVTARIADEWQPIKEELEAAADDATLTVDQVTAIRALAVPVQKALYSEANGKVAFFATDKRYDVQRLLHNVGGLMREGTFESLPYIARYDLAEAGVCIAFERPTAGAFHALRGTESATRHLYACVVRRARMPEPWHWGPIVAALRTRSRPIDSLLLDNLDSLRRHFRNPTQHPEKLYEIEEAQDLFAACVDVLNRMVALPEWRPPDPPPVDVE